MNYIHQLYSTFFSDYYQRIYSTFLVPTKNENILIVNQNDYNPLIHFSHFLKKFNTHLYIIYHSHDTLNKNKEKLQNEECSPLVHIDFYSIEKIMNEYVNIRFNKIVVLHIQTLDYLEKILDIARFFKTNLILYVSLSKSNLSSKNICRSLLKYVNSQELGNVFNYSEILTFIEHYKYYEIDTIKIMNDNYYAVYGSHKNYQIILKPKST